LQLLIYTFPFFRQPIHLWWEARCACLYRMFVDENGIINVISTNNVLNLQYLESLLRILASSYLISEDLIYTSGETNEKNISDNWCIDNGRNRSRYIDTATSS
jgi:hypothetical protein